MPHLHELYDFTASAFILHPTEPKILLLFHEKLQKWLQPGGHVELDENPWRAVIREVKEETGLSPENYTLVKTSDHPQPSGNNVVLPVPFYMSDHPFSPVPGHRHIDCSYLLRAKTATLTEHPDGASAIGWHALPDIAELLKQNVIFKDTYEICQWIGDNCFDTARAK